MKAAFNPGKNIAIKTPAHEYAQVVHFYQEILGFKPLADNASDPFESVCFAFGDKVLWIDKITGLSQSEIWLEIISDDIAAAKKYLEQAGCHIRNEIEPLPDALNAFWLSSPANIIHLVTDK
ncbi:VOC family protein [Thalassomonas haliotis]|uniref:VOC domain-containing protein n=1 Tax=Thalassomonas haliotis TaxID=485448 RepID=A0ABY7V7P4_9GAMM|nr:hypothetical protein [Thalassomonas haliotis]WDE09680.1 hypothetical protein H3N35_15260 [Thalassomonas haliotis]